MKFEAIISGKRLKHAVSVLRKVNDELIFSVRDNRITSLVVDPANTIMVQVDIKDDAGDYCTAPEPHRVGVDLDTMMSILKRAAMTDSIHIYEDENVWSFTRGIHNRKLKHLDIARLWKCQPWHEVSPSVCVHVTGTEFKDIMFEAAAVSQHIAFGASGAGMKFSTAQNEKDEEPYTARLSEDRVEFYPDGPAVAVALYSLDYLQDVAAGMRAKDAVTIKFASDLPCEIKYTRDAVDVQIVLAPRIIKMR